MKAFYRTKLGSAYLGEALDVARSLPDASVNLVLTSPPFPLTFQKKKPYGAVAIDVYISWLLPIADELKRLLTPDGSFVIDLGGVWNKGLPTRSLYQSYLLIALHEKVGFHLAQDFYWYNPGALPAPAEWVNVRRVRVKCAVNQVWWLSKTPFPKANNRNVLKPYSADMRRLIERGYRAKIRPSGHNITSKFRQDHGGSIPPNLIELGNNDSNGEYLKRCRNAKLPVHPARFPRAFPEFFIKLCTSPGDVVLDPFAGSNTTGETAERLGRRWIAIEMVKDYLKGSRFRFSTSERRSGHTPSPQAR
jgi:site-specific DNA-methyltransferase (cytosine-N4-specific)